MRKGIVIAWLILLLTAIGGFFWRSEWVYALPTPVPANYHPVAAGTKVDLSRSALAALPSGKPLFLHFFNPDCPCSRFNVPHFRDLVKRYEQQADFAMVLMTHEKYTPAGIRQRFDLPEVVTVLRDSSIAAACGVYSTPQAVILDSNCELFYRGNYNRNRYCTDEKSSYARLAMEDLLHHNFHPIFDPMALKAYGCKLPTCTQ
ncbi:hypothetical protein Q4E93_10800 [Flavitalea sp. BT771]|uniref:DUF6436 domain-containing protein n=1 Tax=Flavitalea sp. BT771 TaxID=3063329 RepID=UPI0026E236F4|nr:thioredoxin fold domain-containing protein [Flavitalea sp. BT771]MDO6431079.1 hypothetical protein [Flavitalea sp. BT771]MDV6219986.1 hypothetical protein [Flavitalea sp. BT771]